MKKSSRRQRGPVTEEITEAPNDTVSDYIGKATTDTAMIDDSVQFTETLEPEEVGIPIFIFAPKHSKSFRKLAAMQFKDGKVSEAGCILLPDGQIIKVGATVKTEMRPALKVMLRDGVFLAGKAPRRS